MPSPRSTNSSGSAWALAQVDEIAPGLAAAEGRAGGYAAQPMDIALPASRRDGTSTLGATFRAVSIPVFAGLLVRAIPVLTANFPLNDGGLFYTMTRDLQHADFLLPATTSYNGLGIPFAYPPLAFYLAGLLSSIPGLGLLDLFRFLPLIISTLTIPIVYLLARELLSSRFQALLATWAFALLPRAFDWSIAGGGVTRSLGMLLATLAILEGARFYRTSQVRHGIQMAVCAALAVLSHPGSALFTGISLALLYLALGRTRRSLRDSVLLGALAVALTSPWWLTVISAHGLDPFLSGGQSSTDLQASFQHLATFTFTDEPYSTFLAVVGLVGLLHQVARGRYLLPAWVVVVFAIDPRSASAVMLPLAMLIAVAVDEVLLAAPARASAGSGIDPLWPTGVLRDRFGRWMLVVGLMLGLFGAVKASGTIASPLHALAEPNRDAMAWIHDHVPPTAEFLVVSGSDWFVDADAEWFPVLTGHHSLNTVQGYEWLGRYSWIQQAIRNNDLQECTFGTPDCLEKWTQKWHASAAWIYVPVSTIETLSPTGDCCAGLRASLTASGDYVIVYSGPGGTVFRPRSPA